VAEDYWDILLAANPTMASVVGDHRFDDQLEDLSVDAEQSLRREWVSLRERLDKFPRDELGSDRLDRDDRVTVGLLDRDLEDAITAIDQRLVELQSDQMTGFHVGLLQSMSVIRASNAEQAERLLERFRKIPTALDQAAQRYLAGAADGRTPARICVERALNIIDGYLKSPLSADIFVTFPGPEGWEGEPAWRDKLTDVARDVIRPAYQRIRDELTDRLLPVARPDDKCGLSWLADGPAIYATLVRSHTSLELPPEDIHAIGLDEVNHKLPAEYAEIGQRLFGTGDVAEVFDRLRNDPDLRYREGGEIMADAHRALEVATAAMPGWFGRLPVTPCTIEEVPDFLAADAPMAYYYPPAGDGSRGGVYYVNTHDPGKKNRYEAASVGFHEAIPGHHLQLAISTELTGLPSFRRFALGNTAYVEGWGLYSERLAEEMGLYANDLDRMGMLTADSMRACRLVLDTGIHAMGWSRQQAIDFMVDHSTISVEEVTVEVDRYVGMPGQALAYKLGQREIFRLREAARARLRDRFNIKGFHDTVLGSASVSLPILATLVDDWVAGQMR
jgi:uncharacterized protein (DUF885 family)